MAKRRISVDMTGVEAFSRCPEGQWLAKVKKVELGEVQGSGEDALKAQFEVTSGSAKGNVVFETFSLNEKALWKLKTFLLAIGMKADGKMTLDMDKLEGKICGIDVIHDEYNGTKRAKVSAYLKPQDLDGADEEPDDDDEDEDEEEVKPKKKAAPAKKAPAKKRPKDQEDDEEEDDEDDEEEEERPAKKPAKKPVKKTPAKKKPEDDEEDDDDDWEDDDD